jgi:hypothetical protein
MNMLENGFSCRHQSQAQSLYFVMSMLQLLSSRKIRRLNRSNNNIGLEHYMPWLGFSEFYY